MKDDRKQRKKSDRHRDDEKRRRRRDRDESDDVRKRTSRADDSSPSSRGKSRLTEEEERQYEKAQKYLKRKESGSSSRRDRDDSRDRRSHKHSRKDSRKEKKRDRDDPSEDDDMRHSKRDRKDDRHKRKKSSKRHRDEDDRDRKKKRQKANSFRDKARKVDSKLVSLGDVSGVPPTKLLNPEDDYFAYNSHLRLYLYQRHGVYFEDLTSDESHEAFREFARAYNDGKLEGAYYDKSLPDEALDQCKRTQHKWTFRTNKTEERNLDIVRAGVKKQTDYDGNEVEMARARMMQPSGPAFGIKRAAPPGAAMPGPEERGRPAPGEVEARRLADRQLRDRVRVGNAEIHGEERAAAGTFERKLQNRREESSRIHGAARDREDQAYGGVELDDNALYGSGGGRGGASYDEALARERQHRERRQARKAERTDELLKKEEARQKAMFDMLGLSGVRPGEKIKIAPRND